MEQELIQLIKDLSGKVNILYNKREANSTYQEQEMKLAAKVLVWGIDVRTILQEAVISNWPLTHYMEAGTSCNWMGLELIARSYAKSGFIEKRFIEECPFCKNIAPETIKHTTLELSRCPALCAKILVQYINMICKDPTLLCVKTTLTTAKFLSAIALSRYLMLNSIRLVPIPQINSHRIHMLW
ncbi:hypothetical protein BB561_004141 [Smittium simulii]|uniref:Uncharacterized protein n=1 Tax=Smittium simulii TaxID=133385 RepID=A0A2T9YHU4_9FUNG|nr:hypothetical protein BB561_004141 [Smittium simulii]